MLDPKPLPQKLYDRLLAEGIASFTLYFSGGSDESFLTVSLDEEASHNSNLETDIEAWAEDAFEYSGAGDGDAYGDNLTYRLEEKTVTGSEWYMVRQDQEIPDSPLEIQTEGTGADTP